MKKISLSSVFIFLCSFMFMGTVYAGSSLISASSTTVTTGGSVTIKVSAAGLAGKFSVLSSNSGVLSGGTSSVWLENSSQSYTFTAKSVGKATITLNALDVADLGSNTKYTASKSVTISVVKPREKSTNNDLSSIKVEGYEVTPVFDKNTLEYTVSLPEEVEKVKIDATKADNYSSLTGTGEFPVSIGDNKFSLVVTSETGVSKTYNVNVNVEDKNPITSKIDGKTYTVVKRASLLTKPELFTETTITINDLTIPGFINEKNNIVLVGLKDEESNISLYIYNSKDNTYQKYLGIGSSKINFMKLDTDKKVDDYIKSEIKINEISYEGYKNSKNSKYILLYGMNLENSEKGWYSYNEDEKSIQLYDFSTIDEIKSDNEKEIFIYRIIVIALALSTVLSVVLLIFSKKKNKKNGLTVKKMKLKTLDQEKVQ
ncbi:MAG: cadherin-like beta sandwich domain-containing protein [Bacilli bacterium]|nr:cadherin-like beta sandwich domain-containing protein [Bacilli bacterium]